MAPLKGSFFNYAQALCLAKVFLLLPRFYRRHCELYVDRSADQAAFDIR